MTEKIIQVYLDVENENGCWNCKHELGGICEVNLIGAVSYLKGMSFLDMNYYKDMVTGKPPYSVFQVKDYDCVTTLYESGKVMFQGLGADIEANMWKDMSFK